MTRPLWRHFARSRGTWATIGAVAAVNVAGVALRHTVFRLPDASGFGVPWVTLLPFLSACAVGIGVRSPMNELEGTAARSMRVLRCTHAAALLGIAVLFTVPIAATLPPPISVPAALRNLAGLAGLALLSGRVLGGRLAWILPNAYTLAALTAGAADGIRREWAWILAPDRDLSSLLWAIAFALIGAAALAQGATRELAGEAG